MRRWVEIGVVALADAAGLDSAELPGHWTASSESTYDFGKDAYPKVQKLQYILLVPNKLPIPEICRHPLKHHHHRRRRSRYCDD